MSFERTVVDAWMLDKSGPVLVVLWGDGATDFLRQVQELSEVAADGFFLSH